MPSSNCTIPLVSVLPYEHIDIGYFHGVGTYVEDCGHVQTSTGLSELGVGTCSYIYILQYASICLY